MSISRIFALVVVGALVVLTALTTQAVVQTRNAASNDAVTLHGQRLGESTTGSVRDVWLDHMLREDRRYAREDAEHADAPPGTSRLMGSERNVWLEQMVREDRRYAREDAEHANAAQDAAADTARWERMAQYYRAQADEAAQRVRANEATAQRWEAMGVFYTRKAAADAERANDATAARWKAITDFYTSQHK